MDNASGKAVSRPTLNRMDPRDNPIRNLADLTAVWTFVDGGFGYSCPQLFCLHIDADGRIAPAIMKVDDAGPAELPDDRYVAGLMAVHEEVLTTELPGGSLAMMRARPGGRALTEADRTWIRTLHRAQQEAAFASYPLFFATDEGVGIVPPDELVAAA